MRLSKIRSLFAILVVVVLVGGIYGTATAIRGATSSSRTSTAKPSLGAPQAIVRPAQGGGCSGSSCTGYDGGRYGNHITNGGGGSNWLSSNSAVRFDAFRPVPGLVSCTPDNADRGYFDDIGLPRGWSGPTYLHRRVGLSRADINRVIVGVEDAEFFADSVEINLDSGNGTVIDTRPTTNPTHPGSGANGNNWVGSQWLGNKPNGTPFCLPLNGGENVEVIKSVVRPQANPQLFETRPSDTVNGIPRSYFKGILGMKKSQIEIVIDETGLNNHPSGISAYFDFRKAFILVCDDAPVFLAQRDPDSPTYVNPFSGCFWSDSDDSPIHMSALASSFSPDPGNSNILRATVPMKFKKEGQFSFFIIGEYNGTVLYDVNGTPEQVLGQGQVTNVSNVSTITVVSVKSINRNSGR